MSDIRRSVMVSCSYTSISRACVSTSTPALCPRLGRGSALWLDS
jgi:hypothetical protein